MTDPFAEPLPLAPVTTYPPSLPHDVACAMTPEEMEVIREKYNFTEEDFEYILNRHDFKREYTEWRHRLIAEGNSFKLKLRAMSEEFLPTLHQIIHSDLTAPSVKIDAFKYMSKLAELEPDKPAAGAAAQGNQSQTRLVISWEDGKGQVAVETTNGGN